MKLNELLESILNVEHGINLNMTNAKAFQVEKDRFRCRTIDTKHISFSSDAEFSLRLRDSLQLWEQDGTRAVWIRVAIEHSSLVPVITELDFEFHHAQRQYVMLKKWLAKNEPDNTPDYAGQYLGCAGFVVNSRNEVLVVQEKYHTQKHWKLPGGHADPGEEISEAAQREVYEETGIRATFQCVMCFRHQHNYKYGCSDFYFVCLMTPVNENICKGDNEISACTWMDVEDLITHGETTELNRHIAESYIKLRNQGQFTLAPSKVPAPCNVDNSTEMMGVKQLVYSVQPCVIDHDKYVTVLESSAHTDCSRHRMTRLRSNDSDNNLELRSNDSETNLEMMQEECSSQDDGDEMVSMESAGLGMVTRKTTANGTLHHSSSSSSTTS